jgi:hypothetical protein
MALFADLKRRRAIKQYARELPRRLYDDYGASKFFTPGQIATAAKKLKLAPEFMVYGYAMFLSEDAFDALQPGGSMPLSYQDARAEFAQYAPSKVYDHENFYESGQGFPGAGAPDGGHGGTSF